MNDFELIKNKLKTRKDEFKPENVDDLKKGDAKNKLKYTYRFLIKNIGNKSKYSDIKEDIIQNTWELVNNVVHRQHNQRTDARDYILYTYILISSIIERLNEFYKPQKPTYT